MMSYILNHGSISTWSIYRYIRIPIIKIKWSGCYCSFVIGIPMHGKTAIALKWGPRHCFLGIFVSTALSVSCTYSDLLGALVSRNGQRRHGLQNKGKYNHSSIYSMAIFLYSIWNKLLQSNSMVNKYTPPSPTTSKISLKEEVVLIWIRRLW